MKILLTTLLLTITLSSTVFSDGFDEASPQSKHVNIADFFNSDIHVQSNALSICAASFNMYSKIHKESDPAYSTHFNNLGNGAEMAIYVIWLMHKVSLIENIDVATYRAIAKNSFQKSEYLPIGHFDYLNALLSTAPNEEELTKELTDLQETIKLCVSKPIKDLIQKYINISREAPR